jgi:thioredoxin-dependent peroxiredoxin
MKGVSMERKSAVTLKAQPLTLIGEEIKLMQQAPEFTAISNDLKEKTLSDFKDKIKLIASVPSLDTPVCDLQIKRFNEEATAISKDIAVIFISMDLPFAQKRFCQSFKISKVKTLSDHRLASFGNAYGVLIKELRLLSRAIFILDKDNTVSYVEYVKEISTQPNYELAIAKLRQLSA